MKRVLLISLMIFLLFGMLLHTPIVFADENNNSGSSNNSEDDDNSTANDSDGDEDINDSDEDDLNETEDDNDENETEDDEDKDNRDRIKIRSREIITRGNCTIKIERELKIENGKRVEVVKKKMVCADGTREEVKIRIENKLKARFRGNVTDIKIMPDRASEIAIERLRALNFTVELREVSRKGNVSRIVYHARAYKDGRFIGILKLKVRVETQIDPETGEIIGTTKPWWAFFVFGEDSDQTGEDTGEDAEEENETNELTINLSEQNNSSETGTATLVEENGQVVVTLNLTGFAENVSQPAHIHLGVCPDVGAVKYPLTNVLDGESVTTLDVTLAQLENELPLGININKSAEEASVYVSCGDVKF